MNLAERMIEVNQSALDAIEQAGYLRGRADAGNLQMQLDAMRAYAESLRDAYLPAQEKIHALSQEVIELRGKVVELQAHIEQLQALEERTAS